MWRDLITHTISAFSISSTPHISHTDMGFYLVEPSLEFTQVCCYHKVQCDCGFEGLFIILCVPCYISLEPSLENLVKFLSPYLSLTPYYTFDFVFGFLSHFFSCVVKAPIWISVFL